MHLLIVGLNHETASVNLREKFTFTSEQNQLALRQLRGTKSILECVILSTCNRTELYVICDQLHTGEYYTKAFLAEWFAFNHSLSPFLYIKKGQAVVEHLFNVTCGLNSLVVGETQILGQVKSAFQIAQQEGATGTIFNRLFRQAVTLAKGVHSQTELGQNAVSVSYAAVELGKKLFSSFKDKTILLIGSGKMTELTAKHFYTAGAKGVIVLNRTYSKAEEIATKFSGIAEPWDNLQNCLRKADIVISSTGSQKPIISAKQIKPLLEKRHNPLFIIDIAVPRDIEPQVHQLDQVFLYDIDDLKDIVNINLHLRKKEAEKIKLWIDEEVFKFEQWLNLLGVGPLLAALREKALDIQAETIKKIENRLPDLTLEQRRVLHKQTKSIVNQMLRDPIISIKELAGGPKKEVALEMFANLFALHQEMETKSSAVSKEQEARGWKLEVGKSNLPC